MISFGKNTFNEALNNNRIIKAYVYSDSNLIPLLKKNHIPYETVNKARLDKMSGNKVHQGIVFEAKDYRLYALNDIINGKHELIVILDNLKDPHNLGAILRTADAVGVDGVIYKKHQSVSLNDTVAKVSTGAIEYIKCVEVTNLTNTINKLKDEGYWIYGLEADGSIDYRDGDYKRKIALVIGSEGEGISRLVKEQLDYKISLPMNGKITSLNASNAAAIMLYKILEARDYPRG
ncbi:MAG: 23S rRNA (guanosine(2251)-2'-O)-methyltransferase RlmB [Erysipelotrichaceae bacterium]|nr:23S rRNA (guanosine(2251)-2'-O)-methyltransferase RlmB [Erysipelotrichaceae bacterium]